MQDFIQIHPKDNVAVALISLPMGTAICLEKVSESSADNAPDATIVLQEEIPQGHKFALQDLNTGDTVVKYGSPIGVVTTSVSAGSWIHTHNIKTALGDVLTYTYNKVPTAVVPTKETFFMGYRRKDGKAGVRNEIWIIPTVGCVNSVAAAIAANAQNFKASGDYPGIDEIVAFSHPYGCSQMGDDQENTRKILADLVNHPNAGGVLVLGLGCENSNIDELKKYIGGYDAERVRFLVAQESEDEVSDGCHIIKDLCHYADRFQREPISCSELIIGMKCGGSDGLSGITANPVVGAFSDLLISKGGTTILTEVPEMFGAEALLMNRCDSPELFDKTVHLINDFKNYFISHNQTIYENPSPGNKKGGISTLEDKSLGCTQKSGSSAIKGVLSYGEPVSARGLNLLSAPGNDLVASTALAASGAQIVLFTTGRGTPFSCPVPTIKISTNSALHAKKSNWIDFNCGIMLEGTNLDVLKQQLFDYVMCVASGQKVKAEMSGFHDMAIFKQGVTL